MPEMYVSVRDGSVCLKINGDDGRQVSALFNKPTERFDLKTYLPSTGADPVMIMIPNGDDIPISRTHGNELGLLHALADVLGYTVTKK